MLNYFNFQQAKYFIDIAQRLISVGVKEKATLTDVLRKRIVKTRHETVDNFQNNFLVYSLSPVKDAVLIMNIIVTLEQKHQEVKYIDKHIIESYSKLVNLILDNTEDIKEVYLMLTQKCLNKQEVIEIIADCDLQIIMNHAKVDRIVSDFWNGPYETQSFLKDSSAFQEVQVLRRGNKTFLRYFRPTGYKYSISNLWKKNKKKSNLQQRKLLEPQKAHFFHFERWNHSIITKYVIQALVIVIFCYWVFDISIDALSSQISLNILVLEQAKLIPILQNPSLSQSERAQLMDQFLVLRK